MRSSRARVDRLAGSLTGNSAQPYWLAAGPWLADPVLPSFLPCELLLDEILQRDAADVVVQAPPGGDVTDEQDPLPVPAQRQVGEEAADARCGLPPAFPARIRPVQVLAPAGVQLGHRHPVAPPVVAFAQPPVIQHRDRGLGEGNGCCLGSPGQVGAEHRRDPVAPAAAQLPRLHPAPFGQLAGQPAGGASLFVVLGRGVGLKYQLDGHQPTPRTVSRDTPSLIRD
jgi:hypothetical protein